MQTKQQAVQIEARLTRDGSKHLRFTNESYGFFACLWQDGGETFVRRMADAHCRDVHPESKPHPFGQDLDAAIAFATMYAESASLNVA